MAKHVELFGHVSIVFPDLGVSSTRFCNLSVFLARFTMCLATEHAEIGKGVCSGFGAKTIDLLVVRGLLERQTKKTWFANRFLFECQLRGTYKLASSRFSLGFFPTYPH